VVDVALVLVLLGPIAGSRVADVPPPEVRRDPTSPQSPRPFTIPPAQPGPPFAQLPERLRRAEDEAAWRCPMRTVPADPRIDPAMVKTIDPRDAERYTVRIVPPRCRP
jgi:hypothetical protein